MDKKTRKILAILATPREDRQRPHDYIEDELPRVSFDFLREMYFAGLVGGAGRADDRGSGNYKWSRVWWITDKGRAALSESE